jgi:hypothetical protein
LVTDLPADFDVALQGVDTRLKALQPGTTEGDLAYSSATADTNTRLGIGTTDQVLTVVGGVPAWAAAASASGPAFYAFRTTSSQSFSQNTWTKVQLNGEKFDTDNCFDSTTNYRFTPNKAGYYQVTGGVYVTKSAQSQGIMSFYKNGSDYQIFYNNVNTSNEYANGNSSLVYLNGTTDYLELFIYDGDPTTRNVSSSGATYMTGVWIRS